MKDEEIDHIWFTKDGADIAEGIELRHSRSNLWGWSTHEVWLVRPPQYPGAEDAEHIADLYCGEPVNVKSGYGFRMEKTE